MLSLREWFLCNNRISPLELGWSTNLANTLQVLELSHNRISSIPARFFQLPNLQHLDLSRNQIRRVEGLTFQDLPTLRSLKLQSNRLSHLMDGAFFGLSNMEVLDLQNNEISWTIEDMNGPFSALEKMKTLLLCDCQLKWLPIWVAEQTFLPCVNASCAHPQMLKGRSVFSVRQEEFVCDDFPKPKITVQPETQSSLKGTNVTFVCSAASSSDSPMTFAWKKDNEVLNDAEIHNQAHLRVQRDTGSETEVTEYTTTLQLRNVEFSNEGRYQCVISNHFGSSYSTKARLTVNTIGHPSPQIAWQKDGGTDFPAARERRMHVMPEDDVFFIVGVKTDDIGVYSCTAQNTAGAISANATLTVLETPHFLRPLIDRTVAKGETAVLQCIAGGSPSPRLNWTKDDSPLVVTERHFFAAANQLLIIVDAAEADVGKYTCEMSNALGTERGNVRLVVLPNPNCDSGVQSGVGVAMGSGSGADDDGWTTVGIVIIAVVCCVVGTSLVWVVIIYHTRRRNEDCSVTNTDETNLPADIPSYLSSQGTLADRQDAYIPSESGSSHQYIASSYSGFYLQPKDMNGINTGLFFFAFETKLIKMDIFLTKYYLLTLAGLCQLDTGSEADMEAAIDPLLCHYQGPIGSLLCRDNIYPNDPSEVFTGW
ncbi:hypothetical protein GOODEAATRI_014136 [Goodea atripinnis]|uniref:Ig-like domain-containing protein n=1 Tax=Goodea atripinnis TaxID=208336 RepID=A0ABV0MTW3_9TELE